MVLMEIQFSRGRISPPRAFRGLEERERRERRAAFLHSLQIREKELPIPDQTRLHFGVGVRATTFTVL